MKEEYIKFCENTEGVSIFMQPWFLHAVCGENNWHVCLDIAKNGEICGVLVYYVTKKWFFKIIRNPILTPYMGLWIRTGENEKLHKKASQERNVLKNLIAQMPKFSFFSQMYAPEYMNWLPFHWAKFQHTLKVTHVVEGLQNSAVVFDNFKENTQKKIRKAAKTIFVEKSDNPKIVYDIYAQIQKRYGKRMSYSLDFLENLHQQIQKNKAGQLYLAKSKETGEVHAALYIVWDVLSAYYWLGGSDERFRNSGALTFLIYEIMKDVGQKGINEFDFTGSSMENLETYFTSFGAKKLPYLMFTKYGNRFLGFVHSISKN